MEVLNRQGSRIELDRGFRFGHDFFKLLNFVKSPDHKDLDRHSIEDQCDIFYRDIMNYGFAESHNQHLRDGRYDLAAKNLNEINDLSLDPLTGLRKKEFLNRKIASLESDIYLDSISDFSLIMCDLDKFKEINDSFGHSVGDDTLDLFGKLVLESLRPCDFAYRYGGEEFLVLLPETSLSDSVTVAERIRTAIEQRLLIGHYGLNQITAHDLCKSLIEPADDENDAFFLSKDITCSFGVANYLDCSQSGDDLFSRADENLYVAKEEGRNKVIY
ncbi:GGDEF domain-containing protein [Psychromonas aquimarina]|uniref:GGDEF domain-containing protein n=1 Tax=Psychromonas aquimarina TaxID=444919 RepID=UPI0004049E4F|nr:GGDEF domain-containing protein [Psychromonas aquimarina]